LATRVCEICGKRSARYVCQECNRNVCERCLEPHTWLCMECYGKLAQQAPKAEAEGIPLPSFMKFLLIGFSLIIIGIVIVAIASLVYGLPSSLGLVVFIGPIPIVLGAGEYSFLAVIFAVILTIMSIVLFLIMRRQKVVEILH